ncbi:ECF sigma factor [Paenibacillus algorifonticola]|uniref:ECF sigma factor n=1 Tax=Paenibacillus algorifonticola TaxID=684063 RepID=A0A1I2AK82_9BACL|nr:ECF-type sigma factor [Paenibacillus algorifonticola]SFE43948.1 ECF sigma factor [Paenibacillus algorifonticola]
MKTETEIIKELKGYKILAHKVNRLSLSTPCSSETRNLTKLKSQIDEAIQGMESLFPDYAKLLRLRYIDGKKADFVADSLHVCDRTFRRWKQQALGRYADLRCIG